MLAFEQLSRQHGGFGKVTRLQQGVALQQLHVDLVGRCLAQWRKLLAAGNFAQARVHLEQAVQGGDGAAACHLGEMTLKGQGGIPASQEKAASLFQLAQSRNIICFASGQ